MLAAASGRDEKMEVLANRQRASMRWLWAMWSRLPLKKPVEGTRPLA